MDKIITKSTQGFESLAKSQATNNANKVALNQPSQSEIQDSLTQQEETNTLALDDTSMTNNSSATEATGDNKKNKKSFKSGMTVVEEDDVLYRLDLIVYFAHF